jgi:hypothetical protein
LKNYGAEQSDGKIMRRGLLAALAGLVAALFYKSPNAQLAEAVSANLITENVIQTSSSETRLIASPTFSAPAFQILNGASSISSKAAIAASSDGYGVIAQTTAGLPAIFGKTLATGPFSTGIQGESSDGSGMVGLATQAAGLGMRALNVADGTGIKGLSNSGNNFAGDGTGNGAGVHGKSGGGLGVLGEASASNLSVPGIGVKGVSSANNTGVKGLSNATNFTADGTGSGIGVHGKSGSGSGVRGESTSGPGVSGQSVSQAGVDGVSTNSLGVRGTSTNFVGIVGISTNSHGLYGSTSSGVNGYGIVAENLGANGKGMLVNGSAPSQIFGGLQVFGPKNAVLKMQDGTFASVYCQESPEPYFEDFGRAQLLGGVVNVPLEREFATLVGGGEYHVFTEPEGDTRGLFVSRRTPGGFEVREIGGGSGSVPFSYRVVTRRKDIEGKRFARVSTEAAEKVAGVRAVLAAMGTPRASSGPSAGQSSPSPTQQPVSPTDNMPFSTPSVPSGSGSTILPPSAGPSSVPPNARG